MNQCRFVSHLNIFTPSQDVLVLGNRTREALKARQIKCAHMPPPNSHLSFHLYVSRRVPFALGRSILIGRTKTMATVHFVNVRVVKFADVTNVGFPPIYEKFLSIIGIFSLDLGWMLSATCVAAGIDFYDKLL